MNLTNIVFRCRNIVSAFLVLQLSVLSVSGAEKSSARGKELNDAEKLQIIKETILKNQDDRLDWIDPEKICNEIANEMEPDRIETEETKALDEQRNQLVMRKFPETDSQLRIKFEAEAEKMYPLYRIGDDVEVIFSLHGKKYLAAGKYYRNTPNYVWIGNRKISWVNLSRSSFIKLNEKTNSFLRMDHVVARMKAYHDQRSLYDYQLMGTDYQKKSGKIFFYGKWMTLREIVNSRLKFINPELQMEKMYRKVAGSKYLSGKITILQQMQKMVKNRFPDHFERLAEIQNDLTHYKIRYIDRMVNAAEKRKDPRIVVIILESAIMKYPDAKNIDRAMQLLQTAKKDVENENQKILERITVSNPKDLLKKLEAEVSSEDRESIGIRDRFVKPISGDKTRRFRHKKKKKNRENDEDDEDDEDEGRRRSSR